MISPPETLPLQQKIFLLYSRSLNAKGQRRVALDPRLRTITADVRRCTNPTNTLFGLFCCLSITVAIVVTSGLLVLSACERNTAGLMSFNKW